MKQMQGKSVGEKMNITDIMFTDIGDESIQKYKENLLGNLSGTVSRMTMQGKQTPGK